MDDMVGFLTFDSGTHGTVAGVRVDARDPDREWSARWLEQGAQSTSVHGSGAFTRAAEDRSSITQTRSVRSAGMSSAYAPTLSRIGVRLSPYEPVRGGLVHADPVARPC